MLVRGRFYCSRAARNVEVASKNTRRRAALVYRGDMPMVQGPERRPLTEPCLRQVNSRAK